MVFSSIPAYLDPSNWQQQQNHQIIGSSSTNPLFPPPPPPPPPPPQPHGSASIRPGSMAERARLANMPMPETALKCPRCDSTNTKFCYFNNYSLSQPRHFCKTCRRYWTRGGALRNVPVGGGCRRNKRSKSSSTSKSPASSDQPSSTAPVSSTATANMLGLTAPLPPLRFMSPLGQLNDSFTGDIGLNYSGMTAPSMGTNEMNFHGSNLLTGGGGMAATLLSGEGEGGGGSGIQQWRLQQLQQFPFLGGLDTSSPGGMYQFHHGGEQGFMGGGSGETSHHHQIRPKLSSSMLSQIASVKMEDNPEHRFSRQLLGGGGGEGGGGGGIAGNDQQWNSATANWTDLSSFSSSSTSNPL